MSYSDVVIADGPFGYWKLDGNALDSVGNRHGIVAGNPAIDVDRTPDGQQCFSLDGATQFIKFTDSALLQGPVQTLEVILRNKKLSSEFTSFAAVGQVFSRMNRSASPYPQVALTYGYQSGTFGGTSISGLTTAYSQDACSIAITPFSDAWHHVVFTLSDKQAAIYIDGAYVSQLALSAAASLLPVSEL